MKNVKLPSSFSKLAKRWKLRNVSKVTQLWCVTEPRFKENCLMVKARNLANIYDSWFWNLSVPQNHQEGLLKHRLLGPKAEILIQPLWVGLDNLHFSHIPRCCWDCGCREHTLRTTPSGAMLCSNNGTGPCTMTATHHHASWATKESNAPLRLPVFLKKRYEVKGNA